MIVAEIADCLGNQLFTYASTKSVALDLSYQYRYRVVRPAYANASGRDAYGHEWSSEFEKQFSIDTSEKIVEIPKEVIHEWKEHWPRRQNFQESIYKISDYTVIRGHHCTPKYFEHRRKDVMSWFRFQHVLLERSNQKIRELRRKAEGAPLVAVHVRYGRDYLSQRKAISLSYYAESIKTVSTRLGRNVAVVLFSDNISEVKEAISSVAPQVMVADGSMYEDLCLMSLCDAHVVGNSTFGWWGAWLAERSWLVIRPSVFPIGGEELYPLDIFPASWAVGEARRVDTQSSCSTHSMMDKIKRLVQYFL